MQQARVVLRVEVGGVRMRGPQFRVALDKSQWSLVF